jgi:predicted secreted hydrolase
MYGHLQSARGDEYSYVLTFFQLTDASGAPELLAHFAISDPKHGRFYFTTDRSAGQYPEVTSGYQLAVPAGWTAEGGDGRGRLFAESEGFGVDLTLADARGPIFPFADGVLPLPDGSLNFDYARPSMTTCGSITVAGERLEVEGSTWFDHEYGPLIPGTGWTGYLIELNDGESIQAVQAHVANGTTVVAQSATVLDSACVQTSIAPDQAVFGMTGAWQSPASGITYPTSYTLDIASQGLSLTLKPTMQNQELFDTGTPAGTYREADAVVTGTKNGKRVRGRAFVESVNAVVF